MHFFLKNVTINTLVPSFNFICILIDISVKVRKIVPIGFNYIIKIICFKPASKLSKRFKFGRRGCVISMRMTMGQCSEIVRGMFSTSSFENFNLHSTFTNPLSKRLKVLTRPLILLAHIQPKSSNLHLLILSKIFEHLRGTSYLLKLLFFYSSTWSLKSPSTNHDKSIFSEMS